MNTARPNLAGAGADNTSALAFAGSSNGTLTETWNGSSWTEVNDLNTAKGYLGGFGSVSAAIKTGGLPSTAATESWNGTSWTEVNDLNTARYGMYAAKESATAGLVYGGATPTPATVANTETWNGTSFTETSDLNTARFGSAGGGTQASAVAAAGSRATPAALVSEDWSLPVTSTVTFTVS